MTMLVDMMEDTVSVKSATGRADTGEATYGALRTIAAKVIRKKRLIPQADGTALAQNHQLVTNDAIAIEDQIWLPDEDPAVNQSHRPLLIDASSLPGDSVTYVVAL